MAQWRSSSTVLNLGTRWQWALRSTILLLHTLGIRPKVRTGYEVGWAPEKNEKSRSSCEPNPIPHSAHGQSTPPPGLSRPLRTALLKNTNDVTITTINHYQNFHFPVGLSSIFLSSYLKLGINGSELHNHINTELMDLYTEGLSFTAIVNQFRPCSLSNLNFVSPIF
jgi:hypothetical protein